MEASYFARTKSPSREVERVMKLRDDDDDGRMDISYPVALLASIKHAKTKIV